MAELQHVDCGPYISLRDTCCIIDFSVSVSAEIRCKNSASVSFSAETTSLNFGPVSVTAEFIKISFGRSLVIHKTGSA